jgi:hypothetical protein
MKVRELEHDATTEARRYLDDVDLHATFWGDDDVYERVAFVKRVIAAV